MQKLASRLLLVLLMLVAVYPPRLLADSGQSTEVTANAPSFYRFTLPPASTIPFLNSDWNIGALGVVELLLEADESLEIELQAGALQHIDYPSNVLPYDVDFSPPAAIDQTNIGDQYDIRVLIRRLDFRMARSGTYRGTLTTNVRASGSDQILMTGTTDLRVDVPTITVFLPSLVNSLSVKIKTAALVPIK